MGCGHPDLEIRGSWGGVRSSRPLDKGEWGECGHPDLEIRGSGGGGGHPDLDISGGKPGSKKFFLAFLNFRVFIVRDTKIGMRPR